MGGRAERALRSRCLLGSGVVTSFLKARREVIHQPLVEIVAAQLGVAVAHVHLDDVINSLFSRIAGAP